MDEKRCRLVRGAAERQEHIAPERIIQLCRCLGAARHGDFIDEVLRYLFDTLEGQDHESVVGLSVDMQRGADFVDTTKEGFGGIQEEMLMVAQL
ncbi:MAG: hypothetical protein FWD69_02480 [Polyangiaceae bacterium]|nr:hypothetical protein [Polyangiaceae bacterium]